MKAKLTLFISIIFIVSIAFTSCNQKKADQPADKTVDPAKKTENVKDKKDTKDATQKTVKADSDHPKK